MNRKLSPSLTTAIALVIFSNDVVSHNSDDFFHSSSCQVSNWNESSLFGTESDSTQSIKYGYKMEYDGNVVGSNDNADIHLIINEIEIEISNGILMQTSLFEECKEDDGRKRKLFRSRRLMLSEKKRKLEQSVIGLTSKPDDTYTVVDCKADAVSSQSTCMIVQGELTLYLQNESSQSQNEDGAEILTFIQSLLDDDVFPNKVDTSILKLEFYDSNIDSNGATIDTKLKKMSGTKKSLMVLGSITAAGLVGYGGYKFWYMHKNGLIRPASDSDKYAQKEGSSIPDSKDEHSWEDSWEDSRYTGFFGTSTKN